VKFIDGDFSGTPDVVCVIMAGGSGTRFWPASRKNLPKQFLKLASDDESLIQATARRVEALSNNLSTLVVTAENQQALVREHLPEVGILSEPSARNTAAALAYAALLVSEQYGDVPMVCLPADHFIQADGQFCSVLRAMATVAATQDEVLTIGIRPSAPETGYGYIKVQAEEFAQDSHSVFRVERFVEKPNQEKAKEYLSSGDYFWNSGIFCFRPSVLFAATKAHLPQVAEIISKLSGKLTDAAAEQEIRELYGSIDPISIDFGVMEKIENVLMVPGEGFSWSDVGSWTAWGEVQAGSSGGRKNVLAADGELIECEGTVVMSAGRFIAGIGLRDMIVVDTPDALLVCPRDRAQDVRKVVELLKSKGRTELL